MIFVFSKDRAFQLEACLRTLLAQCEDVVNVPIWVLWTASSPSHRQAYDVLREFYKFKPDIHIEFVEESGFRSDLVMMMGNVAPGSWADRFVRMVSGSRLPLSIVQALISPFLRPAPAVLFSVDDTLFVRPFSFSRCSQFLLAKEEALAFSLRLGQGLTHFYMADCAQEAPAMTLMDEASQTYQFRWTEAKGEFEFPLEVSSSILKLSLILTRILRKKWRTPNSFESVLARMVGRYREAHPLLLTFREPRAFSVPLNLVQSDFADNRHGTQDRYHPDALCALFLKGVRADLSGLKTVRPISVHAEVDLLPAEK